MKKITSIEWVQSLPTKEARYFQLAQIATLKLTLSKPLSPQLTERKTECLDMLRYMHYLDSLWGANLTEYILQELTNEELWDLLLRVEFASAPLNTTESEKSVTLSSTGEDC